MADFFQKLDVANVIEQPFPYVVIEDFLPADACAALLASLPPVDTFSGQADAGSNKRFTLSYEQSMAAPKLAPIWRDVLSYAMSQAFLERLLRLFGPSIQRVYPDFEQRFGALHTLRAIQRTPSVKPSGTVALDSQIAINTPARVAGSTVNPPHLDRTDKLFVGLLYLRQADDHSSGADLELLAPALPPKFGPKRTLPRNRMTLVRTVPYRANTLVMFLNTPSSFHAVTPRGVTSHARYFINLVGEMPAPLFDVRIEPSPAAQPAHLLARMWQKLPLRRHGHA